jgi:hypothetical protein
MRHGWPRARNEIVIVHSRLTNYAIEIDSITDVSEEELLRVAYLPHCRFRAVLEPLHMSSLILAIDVNYFRKPE